MLFLENTAAKHYYQIESGIVKMNNFNDDGKEFIQGVFYKTQSFGEPPLFIDVNYPANAQALTDVVVFILSKDNFYKLLYAEQSIHLAFTKNLAKRLYYKAIIASEISSQEPEHRILRFFDYLKDEHAATNARFSYKIPYTRQQIADTLGLRVETVIRVTKRLEKKQNVKIINRKVFR
jgi:cAMP-binding proteins - catabolite gene activator and regulatory subunit of cAMP-dependent protein kinases